VSNTKVVFAFIIGLIVGLAGGYMGTDLHYRHLESARPVVAPAAQGQGEEAMPEIHSRIKALEDMLKKEPGNVEAGVELGNMYYDARQFQKAIGYYQRALELKPDQPNVLADMGTAFRETGEPEKALECYDRAYGLDKTHWKSMQNALVVSMSDLKDRKRAGHYLDLLKALNPPGLDLKPFEAELQKLP